MEFMGGGCLTEVLEQFEHVKLAESAIAFACAEVFKQLTCTHVCMCVLHYYFRP